jgi:hypothetical protein
MLRNELKHANFTAQVWVEISGRMEAERDSLRAQLASAREACKVAVAYYLDKFPLALDDLHTQAEAMERCSDCGMYYKLLAVRAALGDAPEKEEEKASDMLPTQNKTWGFYGTIFGKHELWDAASREAMNNGLTRQEARDFLDSKSGRHFADKWNDHGQGALEQMPNFLRWWRKGDTPPGDGCGGRGTE